jgi:beta-glucosidase
VTAILWAGVPGQESGNSIIDILYGKVNPAARTPFTWGPTRESYGTDVLYTPNNGMNAPQIDFTEGVFIDYRAFDKQNITPIYEFGFGLSYTTFEYSNLQINGTMAGPYTPTTGMTQPAPVFGNYSTNLSDYQFPYSSFPYVQEYIYPYLNSMNASAASVDPCTVRQRRNSFHQVPQTVAPNRFFLLAALQVVIRNSTMFCSQ